MLQSLKSSTFQLKRWADAEKQKANSERMQSERCVNVERNLVNDMWTVNSERTQNANLANALRTVGEERSANAESFVNGKCKRTANAERMVNERWANGERAEKMENRTFQELYQIIPRCRAPKLRF